MTAAWDKWAARAQVLPLGTWKKPDLAKDAKANQGRK